MSGVIKPTIEFGHHISFNHKPSQSIPHVDNHLSLLAEATTHNIKLKTKITVFPTSFSLSSKFLLTVLDQGVIGSCVANSYADIIASLRGIVASRLYLYYNARVACGDSPNEDTGLDILQAYPIFKSFGLPLESNWPYDTNKFNVLPDYSKTYKIANNTTVVNIAVIPQSNFAIKTALTANKFIIFGIIVYDSFMSANVAKTGIIPVPNPSTESEQGGHCMHIVGWCKLNDIEYYIIRNSWGLGWGNNGATTPNIGFKNNGKNGGFAYIPTKYVLDPNFAFEFLSIA